MYKISFIVYSYCFCFMKDGKSIVNLSLISKWCQNLFEWTVYKMSGVFCLLKITPNKSYKKQIKIKILLCFKKCKCFNPFLYFLFYILYILLRYWVSISSIGSIQAFRLCILFIHDFSFFNYIFCLVLTFIYFWIILSQFTLKR